MSSITIGEDTIDFADLILSRKYANKFLYYPFRDPLSLLVTVANKKICTWEECFKNNPAYDYLYKGGKGAVGRTGVKLYTGAAMQSTVRAKFAGRMTPQKNGGGIFSALLGWDDPYSYYDDVVLWSGPEWYDDIAGVIIIPDEVVKTRTITIPEKWESFSTQTLGSAIGMEGWKAIGVNEDCLNKGPKHEECSKNFKFIDDTTKGPALKTKNTDIDGAKKLLGEYYEDFITKIKGLAATINNEYIKSIGFESKDKSEILDKITTASIANWNNLIIEINKGFHILFITFIEKIFGTSKLTDVIKILRQKGETRTETYIEPEIVTLTYDYPVPDIYTYVAPTVSDPLYIYSPSWDTDYFYGDTVLIGGAKKGKVVVADKIPDAVIDMYENWKAKHIKKVRGGAWGGSKGKKETVEVKDEEKSDEDTTTDEDEY